ncbi:tRNA synthetases class I, catalytic domain-containing protein [Mycena sp. CBHHK59/15]|nr:tRNA synthetases class I, catalytic domain-containing protein [Mycena sp. CBHHK59/15]
MSKHTIPDAALDPLVILLQSIGLPQAKAIEAIKSPKIAAELKDIIDTYSLSTREPKLDDKQAGLIVALAGQLVKSDSITEEKRSYVIHKILDAKLKTVDQVNAAAKYVEGHSAPIDDDNFDTNCGVGFSITSAELYEQISKYTTSAAVSGWASLGQVISAVKGIPELRWANTLEVKNAVEKVFNDTFGAKEPPKPKGKEPKKAGAAKTGAPEPPSAEAEHSARRKVVFDEGFLGQLHKPGENPQIHPNLRSQHLVATGGHPWTRFPPEPNGYLHIGHSKAIFVNFGYAAHYGGKCYLRYDDTNPEKEEAQYFDSILEMVRWLGFEPWKITYSSDYFQQLYDLAVELIKRDKAYVCHCTREEIKIARGEKSGQLPKACAHRTRPISESLAEFENMKDGVYRAKEANLRMKQDLEDGNPQMWDLTAYRVLEASHHRTHNKWKIYPTYDYTHCLVDSFENISHSLCTTEFVASRQSYEWLCDALEVYKPRQSEFGRLNLEGTIMSKRKILALVDKGYVTGWDDPRLYTLIALRRRGVPPGAIVSFVSMLGVSTASSNIELARFEQTVRHYLEGTAPRLLMVMRPLKVTIENLPEDYLLMVEKPLHPKVAALGSTTIPFTRTIFIDADDFRLKDSKDYFRLAPGKTVGLFQAPHPITCTSYKTDPASGQVIELICRLENQGEVKKPKAYIQWVAEHAASGSPVRINETRIFHQLFKSDQPSANFLDDVDPNSLEIVKGAMVEVGFWSLAKRALTEARRDGKARTAKALQDSAPVESSAEDNTPHATSEQLVGNECIRFQGLRVAYFAVDKDSRLACLDEADGVEPVRKQGDYLVLNRIVSLKEDSGKAA